MKCHSLVSGGEIIKPFRQGKRIKTRSSFETDYRMKTPCAIHRRDAGAPCISKTQRDFNAFALTISAAAPRPDQIVVASIR
jgi:hypothetical protein